MRLAGAQKRARGSAVAISTTGRRCRARSVAAAAPQRTTIVARAEARAINDDEDGDNVDEDDSTLASASTLNNSNSTSTRRSALLSAAATAAASSSALWLGAGAGAPTRAAAATAEASSGNGGDNDDITAVTARAFLDVALCPSGYRQDRALGDPSALCNDPTPLGRIVVALYGNAAPGTVEQFLALARGGELDGTLFHKIVKGAYIMAGKQGSRRMGELSPSWATLLPPRQQQQQTNFSSSSSSSSSSSLSSTPPSPNPDLLNPAVFDAENLPPLLRHLRPGTLSLALGANDDDEALRLRPGYRPAEFLITTGPGPVPALDGGNVVFGRVEQGLVDVVAAVTSRVKTIGETPGPFASVATLLGDERIERRKAKYGRPLQLVVITKAGVL